MNAQEFNQWFTDFSSVFPWAPELVRKASPPEGIETLAHWREVLERVSLADALAATNIFFSDEREHLETWDRWRAPIVVKRIAVELRERRNPTCDPVASQRAYEARALAEGPPTWSCAEELKRKLNEKPSEQEA